MDNFLLLFVAAVVGEGIIEYLVAPLFDKWKMYVDPLLAEQLLRLVSCLVGIAIAWQLQLKFFLFAFGISSLSPWFDLVVTGIAIGRGSNYVHDLLSKLQTGPGGE